MTGVNPDFEREACLQDEITKAARLVYPAAFEA
jgi:hypothetical protein